MTCVSEATRETIFMKYLFIFHNLILFEMLDVKMVRAANHT